MALSVLYVCTANISRSPYLTVRSTQLTSSDAGATAGPVFGGAGTLAIDGEPMDPQMAALLVERGADPSAHRSRGLTPGLLRGADLVLTATADHRRWILADDARAVRKIFTVGQFAANVAGLDPALTGAALLADAPAVQALRRPAGTDLEDPFGRSEAIARRVAETIDELLDVILPRLA